MMTNEDINKFIQDTSTSQTGTACNYNNACAYKLPCGLCRLLMSQCPEDCSYPNITWTASDKTAFNYATGATRAVVNDE